MTRLTTDARAQSSIIGVAILVTATVLSIAALTATAGTFVSDGAAAANAQRVAEDFDDVVDADKRRTRIEFSDGTLRVEPRTLTVSRGDGALISVDVDALVYETRGQRVTTLAGVVVEGSGPQATVRGPLPVVAGPDRHLVDIVALNATGATGISGSTGTAVSVRTNATHEYRTTQRGEYSVAIETATPGAWERAFTAAGLEHTRRDDDDDGVESVVVRLPDDSVLDVAIHDLRAVVSRG